MAYDGADVVINTKATAEQYNWLKNVLLPTAHKEADETVNNNTGLQDDDDLVVTLEANKYYAFELWLEFNSTAVADIKFAFTIPAGATVEWGHLRYTGASLVLALISGTGTSSPADGAGADSNVYIRGFVYTAAAAGDLQLQWAQQVLEATDTKVLEGSWLKVVRLL